MIDVPIYRGLKIGKKDEWIEGILLPKLKRFDNKTFIINEYTRMQDFDNAVEIDPETIGIHLPGMIDKNSNKMFASFHDMQELMRAIGTCGECIFRHNDKVCDRVHAEPLPDDGYCEDFERKEDAK